MVSLFGGPLTSRWTDRLLTLTAVRLVLWLVVVATTHAGIFSDPWNLADWMDDHQFYSWEESDRMTLLQYGQLPLWNPFWCGGTVVIAAPEDPFLSPDFLLRLVFGVAHGRRLAILLLVVLGFEGMYRLCRKLDASAMGAVFAALVYGTCDLFIGFIHDGWVHFLGFELIPWVALAVLEGMERKRWRIVGGLFLAWIVLAPGTYPVPYTMIVVGYLCAAISLYFLLTKAPAPASGKWWDSPPVAIWVSAAVIGLVAFAVSFGKLVPTLLYVRQFARTFTPTEVHEAGQIFSGVWGHYGIVIVLALVAAATADRAAAIFLGGSILAFALARGDYGHASPFHLLKALPIFGQLRFPERYMVLFLFFTSVAAARGITRFEDGLALFVRRLWERTGARVKLPPFTTETAWVVTGIAAVATFAAVRPLVTEVLTPLQIKPHGMYVEPPPRAFDQPFKQHRGNRRDAHVFPPMNMGSLYCVSGNPLVESPLLRADLPQEEYPSDPTKATVKRLKWSPTAIDLEVDASEPTTIYVNQNWSSHWHASVGTVKSVQSLLAVDVPAGKNVVRLSYSDGFAIFCLLVSLVAAGGLFYLLGRDAVRFGRAEWARYGTLPQWPGEPAPVPPAPPPTPEATSTPAEDAAVEEPAPAERPAEPEA